MELLDGILMVHVFLIPKVQGMSFTVSPKMYFLYQFLLQALRNTKKAQTGDVVTSGMKVTKARLYNSKLQVIL